jgi:hypothetical protein
MFSDIFEIERAWRDADAPARMQRAATEPPYIADAPSIVSELPEEAGGGWLTQLKAKLRRAPSREHHTAA